jgi:lipopolysaccharide/colanic/teichoic acid biosynthesis glycosyltransferase
MKRLLDVTGAALGLVILSPVMVLVAAALLATQGRPIFFRHERPGLGGRPFTLLKFRTMRPPSPVEDRYRSDELRMTRIGRVLRSTSVDELPELWNVLRGDMSLVGPRPLLTEYLDTYTTAERRRHDMRPGITGWAVVNGRHTLKFKDRLALDAWYVGNWSLTLDFRILAMTLRQVVRREATVAAQDIDEVGFPLPPRADDLDPDPSEAGRGG